MSSKTLQALGQGGGGIGVPLPLFTFCLIPYLVVCFSVYTLLVVFCDLFQFIIVSDYLHKLLKTTVLIFVFFIPYRFFIVHYLPKFVFFIVSFLLSLSKNKQGMLFA